MPASKFKNEFCAQAEAACAELGATDAQLGKLFSVTRATIHNWKKKYPEFQEALDAGKEIADTKVIKSLFQRATGYSHPETKVFYDAKKGEVVEHTVTKYYPPDTVACIFWSKNRMPEEWKDKHDHQHSGEVRTSIKLNFTNPTTE